MTRVLVAACLAVAAALLPVTTASACSCAMPGSLVETVAGADFAFVGTVVDVAPLPEQPEDFGPMFRSAFEVERASAASDPVTEIRSIGNDGGASCGFQFGIGERWFVVAHRDGASLSTNLCSGNLLVEGLGQAEVDQLAELLPVEPAAADPTSPEASNPAVADLAPIVPWVVGVLAVVAIMVMAFRDGRPRPPA